MSDHQVYRTRSSPRSPLQLESPITPESEKFRSRALNAIRRWENRNSTRVKKNFNQHDTIVRARVALSLLETSIVSHRTLIRTAIPNGAVATVRWKREVERRPVRRTSKAASGFADRRLDRSLRGDTKGPQRTPNDRRRRERRRCGEGTTVVRRRHRQQNVVQSLTASFQLSWTVTFPGAGSLAAAGAREEEQETGGDRYRPRSRGRRSGRPDTSRGPSLLCTDGESGRGLASVFGERTRVCELTVNEDRDSSGAEPIKRT